MTRVTTYLTRSLVVMLGGAILTAAGTASLDAGAGVAMPASVAGSDEQGSVCWRGTTALAASGAVATVAPEASTPAVVARDEGHDAALVARLEHAVAPRQRAVLLAHSAQGLLPDGFLAGFSSTIEAQECRDIVCSDRQALAAMLGARADLALVAGELTRNQLQSGLRQQTLGVELFAVQVAATCQVRSLSVEQVRRIFTGEVADWQQLGHAPGVIVPVVPAQPTLLARAARVLLAGEAFGAACRRDVGQLPVGGVRIVRVTEVGAPDEGRLLRIGDVPPTADAYFYGHYPFGLPLQVITPGPPEARARELLAYARTPDGRQRLGAQMVLAAENFTNALPAR